MTPDEVVTRVRERIALLANSRAGLRPYRIHIHADELAALEGSGHHNPTTRKTYVDGVLLETFGKRGGR